MKNHQMNIFIQAVYGTVYGISFYTFFTVDAKLFQGSPSFEKIVAFFGTDKGFYFVLFLFTTIIIAHDWYSYHSNITYNEDGNRPFWYYVPQIFSLYFMAQMFCTISSFNFQYWFVFGFFYTLCNIVTFIWNAICYQEKNIKLKVVRYVFHVSITLLTFTIDESFSWICYYSVLLLTGIVVVVIWGIERTWKDNTVTSEEDKTTITEDQINKVRENIAAIKTTIKQLQTNVTCMEEMINN